MLSRIFWIGLAGTALIVGMVLQDGGFSFGWNDDAKISAKVERTFEERVDRAIDRSFDKMEVTDSDGREIDIPADTKRAMAAAVAELVKAETDLAMSKVNDGDDKAMQAAQARSDRARAEVDRLKAEIKGLDKAEPNENASLGDQIQREVQQDVRQAVRESARN